MQTFEELYQKLNTEQQLAVDAIEGPVMVIAGPGTGKTQILATRILNILKKTDTQPQNILCLTYTEAGSTAMQKRLSQFMGPDAYKVPIYTFHGLCNKIIQDYPEKFSRRELRVMDELDKIDLVQGLIEKLPAQSILKSYNEDAQQIRKDLTKLWALMQSEEIDASQINDWITFLSDQDNYKLAFPNHTYKVNRAPNMAGDLKMKDYDQAMTSWKKAKAAADLYENYKEAKAAAGLYEFSDMLEWVAKAFDTDEELLITYQEQFQYILVDEYQDTSGIQNHILYKLIDYWQDEPNCFVVGDDDQSVYAFQGAKVSNMLKFAEKYETHLKTVVLVKNYRSTQPILDSAKRLIDKNTLRLVNQMKGLSKDLVASGENLKYPQLVPSNNLFNNEFHEAVGVAETIKKLIAEGETPNEIAVLFPQNKHALVLADAFNAVEVPFVIHRPVNILNETLIQHLINWLEYLSLELEMPNSGEHLIYKLLVSPLYDISSFEVNQMSVSIYADRSSSRKDGKEKYTWREHIQKIIKSPTQGDMFTNSPSEALKELWNNIEVWIKEASWLTVPELIRDIYSKGGYLAYALKSHDQEWTLEVLQTFMAFAIRMSEKTPFMKPHEFIATVKKMINNDITVPLEKRIGTAEGVQFITAHSSKGLEFEHVFVVRANQTEWEKSDTGRMPYRILSLIHGKSIQLKNATSDEESSEERRRLFYVAITRAKKTLHISYNQKRITATKVSDAIASTFVSEALESEASECTTIPSERLIFTNQAMLLRTSKPKLKSDKMEWIASRTANFKFSPSTLYSILECGLKFYFTRIVRVPDAPSPAAAFGTAMHGAMHKWVDRWTKDKVWMSESDLKVQFDKEMYKERHAFNEKQFNLRMQQGHDVLPAYYLARKDEFKQYSLVQTERMINAVIDGVNISGFLDKMIFDGNRVTVVDYKTGKPENSAKKAAPPGPRSQGKLPNAYWFQLGIYQLMSNLQPGKSWQCNMALIDCIEKDEKGEFPLIKLHYDDDQNKLLREWIAKANHQLQTLEFMNGCGKAECYWCNFAKQTEQVILMPREADHEEGNTSETD